MIEFGVEPEQATTWLHWVIENQAAILKIISALVIPLAIIVLRLYFDLKASLDANHELAEAIENPVKPFVKSEFADLSKEAINEFIKLTVKEKIKQKRRNMKDKTRDIIDHAAWLVDEKKGGK